MVESYRIHQDELERIGVDLEDWIDYDPELQKMKLEHASKVDH